MTLRKRVKRLARKTIYFSRAVGTHKKSSAPLSKTYILLI
ncbi:hypothetical protein DBV23_15175 [Edwardsiella ictaluri]|nr:hypothetical protein DBV23_15175 [Edwardsiella ictaluri]EKS7762961.1 hypothetical protein [Edwardsiella ictaluri]EKS7769873.1 hypothetical protein [Edwardsiella ictaluri]EKS7772926.1 hypothetical protein [Edwardsiella ictaluri]EKS7776472.1 hypothetical protein [Edwardsiella ictaluri]